MPKGQNSTAPAVANEALGLFHPAVRNWFEAVFPAPTRPQLLGWPAIARGDSTLILAPTGTGKTLAAFLWCIDRLMFFPAPAELYRCRILYISPIKALAVDVERNLQSPLIGIAHAAQRLGVAHHQPTVSIRTGDTPPAERARFLRHPSDILVTTPESLYLLLTSNARESLRSIEAVIVDEIHALAPTKRGSHLSLSLERLQHLTGRRLQRIGLSATQRPLDEIAHFLCGASAVQNSARGTKSILGEASEEEPLSEFISPSVVPIFRPVTIIDAGESKNFSLKVQVPVEDMSRLDEIDPLPSGPASQGPKRTSLWSAIHPKLLDLIRHHRSTLIFVNSRRLAERIAGAVNELAGEILVRAHHGSVAVEQRKDIEDRLKLGTLRGLVATSSLELGIDMGAIDLVILIESPPSVASGMQRVGRANHHVGAVSTATIFPKYRADLLACAAVSKAMADGAVESTHYPRNPLDVLAQQIVAIVALENWKVEDLFKIIRSAAPYAALTRSTFENLLDLLSGRYPSDEFTELRPRLTWDRVAGELSTRQGARRVAVINGGTIPDRGLYGVFLGGATKGARVGELDEEMVFETREGDTIILGASTWRVDEIGHDRVTVSPAPGEPGKMPFWKGDGPGRPAEFGEKIGQLTRELLRLPRPIAFAKLVEKHSLDANAAENLLHYIDDQRTATIQVPSDTDIVIEQVRDELGDRRLCVLSPFGSRVHAPWCMAATAKLRAQFGWEVEFRPAGSHREWCDPGVLQQIRRKSLARLRREVEPVEQHTFARFLTRWQGLTTPRRGLEALLDTIETLQGTALLASDLERDILPARIAGYQQADIDTLLAAGEIVWLGLEQVGDRDGRIALFLADSLPLLLPPPAGERLVSPASTSSNTNSTSPGAFSPRAQQILDFLHRTGASFFSNIHAATGAGYPGETLDALWELVWSGQISNDTFHPLRTLIRPPNKHDRQTQSAGAPGSPEFSRRLRSRTSAGGPAQGRWSLVHQRITTALTPTQWTANIAQQFLIRYGIVMRDTAIAENIRGGYNTIYPALKTMEESGRIRRGMFIAGLGAAQFVMPAAVDILRGLRLDPQAPEVIYLAATDPANPYGTILSWPRPESESQNPFNANSPEHHGMSRTSGAAVILINGRLAAFFRRRNPAIRVFLPEAEPDRTHFAQELARKLAELAIRRQGRRSGLLIGQINEAPAHGHALARFLEEAGFVSTAMGFQMRRVTPFVSRTRGPEHSEEISHEDDNVSETA